MGVSCIHGREFLRQIRPLIEKHDVADLLRHLERHWPKGILLELLDCDDPDAVKTALVCLAMAGTIADNARLARLLHDDDPAVVGFAEYALWSIWFRAGNDQANAALHHAVQLISEECLDLAVERLTDLIARCPQLAEAYNQRAIALFLRGDYAEAAEDCARTLRLNPYHFGALAGLGHCHAAQGQLQPALDAYRAALKLHPRLEGIRQSLRHIHEGLRRPAPEGSRPSSL